MDMLRVGQDYFNFIHPIFLNSDNPTGYNNQPYFMNNDQLLVTSQRDGKQTDIYAYNFKTSQVTRLTRTNDVSEFSPMMIPNQKAFSAVCIEEDGATQRLWKYSIPAPMTRSVLMDEITEVGYYHWIDERRAAVYRVGSPSRLEIININTQTPMRYAANIGRSIQRFSNGDLCYLQKDAVGDVIKRLDVVNLDITPITNALEDSEDFAILEDDTILMAKGDKLYKFHPDRDRQWSLIADLQSFKIKNITRIAVSKNKIAIVATPK